MEKYFKYFLQGLVVFILIFTLFFFNDITNIVPSKYLIFGGVIFLLLLVIIFICSFGNTTIKLIGYGLSFIVLFLGILINSNINLLNDLLGDIMSKDQMDIYYIISNKDIELSDDLKIGIYENNLINYDKVMEDIEYKLDYIKDDDVSICMERLFNDELDGVLIGANYLDVLISEDEELEAKLFIIKTFEYVLENDLVDSNVDVSSETFSIFISGSDRYGELSTSTLSDVNMIATINPVTYEILLTSIPRDYYLQLSGTSGYKDKLTHAGVYGISTSVKTIEELFDINIDYYLKVNFTTLIDLVDIIGGITFYNDISFIIDGVYYKKGELSLDGRKTLLFTRARMMFVDGDVQRVKNQQKVLTAIINKVSSSSVIINNYADILKVLGGTFETNMPQEKIYELINLQLSDLPKWDITSYNVTGYDGSEYTYSYPRQYLYVMFPNYDTVEIAKKKILAMY